MSSVSEVCTGRTVNDVIFCGISKEESSYDVHISKIQLSRIFHILFSNDNPIAKIGLYASSRTRDANSLAIFIPRGFGESGNGSLSFLGDRGNKNLFPGFRVRIRGNFGEYFVSDLKLI